MELKAIIYNCKCEEVCRARVATLNLYPGVSDKGISQTQKGLTLDPSPILNQ